MVASAVHGIKVVTHSGVEGSLYISFAVEAFAFDFGLLLLQKDHERRMSSMTKTLTLGSAGRGSNARYVGQGRIRAACHRFLTESAYAGLLFNYLCC